MEGSTEGDGVRARGEERRWPQGDGGMVRCGQRRAVFEGWSRARVLGEEDWMARVLSFLFFVSFI